jgi:energy-coupling factor transporter transmembrane protein EcfT
MLAIIWALALGILQNLASNWLTYLLGGIITAALAYWAKISENLSWPMTIIVGLIITTCFTVLYSYTAEWGRNYFAVNKTVEEQVKEGLDEPGYRLTRIPSSGTEAFHFMTELPMGGLPIHISQPMREPTTIEINTIIPRDPRMHEFFL